MGFGMLTENATYVDQHILFLTEILEQNHIKRKIQLYIICNIVPISLPAQEREFNGLIILHDLDPRGHWGKFVHAGITQFLQDHVGFSISINENLGLLTVAEFL